MTQEEKELVLRDLCARLPYGVIVDYKENEFETPHWKITTIYPNTFNGWIGYDKRVGAGSESGSRPFHIGEVKPYLRPMSSMTEEESAEILNIINEWFDKELPYSTEEPFLEYALQMIDCSINPMLFDWLNKKMFDFRGLIPKGLANSTEKFNPYKD